MYSFYHDKSVKIVTIINFLYHRPVITILPVFCVSKIGDFDRTGVLFRTGDLGSLLVKVGDFGDFGDFFGVLPGSVVTRVWSSSSEISIDSSFRGLTNR